MEIFKERRQNAAALEAVRQHALMGTAASEQVQQEIKILTRQHKEGVEAQKGLMSKIDKWTADRRGKRGVDVFQVGSGKPSLVTKKGAEKTQRRKKSQRQWTDTKPTLRQNQRSLNWR